MNTPSTSPQPNITGAVMTPEVMRHLLAQHPVEFQSIVNRMCAHQDDWRQVAGAIQAGAPINLGIEAVTSLEVHPEGRAFLKSIENEGIHTSGEHPIIHAIASIKAGDSHLFEKALRAVSRQENLQNLLEKSDFQDIKLPKLFERSAPATKIQVSGYAMLAASMLQQRMTSKEADRLTQIMLDINGAIDPLSPAVVIRDKSGHKSYNHLDFILSHAVAFEPLIVAAKGAYMISDREAGMRSTIEAWALGEIESFKPAFDGFSRNTTNQFCNKLMIAYAGGFGPDVKFLKQKAHFDTMGQMPLRLCLPICEMDGASTRPGSLVAMLPEDKKASHRYPVSILAYAAENANHPSAALALIEMGVDINECHSSNGVTPLHAAALRLNPAVITQMVMAGANLNARDIAGRTPLDYAGLRNPGMNAVKNAEAKDRFAAIVDSALATLAVNKILEMSRESSQKFLAKKASP